MDEFDIAVIGAGPAGVTAALRGAERGARVCLIEQDRIGGSCFRKGLYPAKAVMALIEAVPSENGSVDVRKFFKSIDEFGESLSQSWRSKLDDRGVQTCLGRAVLSSPTLIQVETPQGSKEVFAKKIILAIGSHPTSLPNLPFEGDSIVPIDDALQSDRVPATVLILGAGPRGCELATLFNRLGSKVFLSDQTPRLLTGQDPDVTDFIEGALKKQKIKLLLNKRLVSYYKNNNLFDISLEGGVKFQVEKIVLNMTREGSVSGLNSERLGLRLGEGKGVLVNETLETSVPGIFAAGSVIGRTAFAGLSEEEGRVAADSALGKAKPHNADWVPFIVHTRPEIATVGCFAEEAHHKGFRAVEGRFEAKSLDYALVEEGASGFFKVAADKKSGTVIGVQLVSPRASELISLVLLAMKKGIKVGALASLTGDGFSEIQGIREAAKACSRALKSQAKVP